MRILISITSWNKEDKQYLQQVISNYQQKYADLDVFFVLSINYLFDAPPNSVILPTRYKFWQHAWNNKEYIRSHYVDYDYIIESDADCRISRGAFDYYVSTCQWLKDNAEPLNYMPGHLSMEESGGNKYLITMIKSDKDPNVYTTLSNKNILRPCTLHSTCMIVDTERYGIALYKGLKHEPCKWGSYTVAETAISGIYEFFVKIITIDDIKNTAALVHHLPNKYCSKFPLRYYTLNEFGQLHR